MLSRPVLPKDDLKQKCTGLFQADFPNPQLPVLYPYTPYRHQENPLPSYQVRWIRNCLSHPDELYASDKKQENREYGWPFCLLFP